jgi:quercetin dioxygenase-like cupin family protein
VNAISQVIIRVPPQKLSCIFFAPLRENYYCASTIPKCAATTEITKKTMNKKGRQMAGHYPDRIKQLPVYDGRFDAHKLTAQGADELFASYPAGTQIPPHIHNTDNYGVITRGELLLSINGKTQKIGIGQWYHVPAGVEHAAAFVIESDEIEFWFKQ